MKKCLILILMLFLPVMALAAELPPKADPTLVSVLMPGHQLVRGITNKEGNELRLLMRRPDGQLVFAGGVHDPKEGWKMTVSTPLPEGSFLGVENFVTSIGIGGTDVYAVTPCPYPDGSWGVDILYPDEEGLFRVGPNWVLEEGRVPTLVGDHPWSDITTIDWSSLPKNYEDALSQVDHANWALVSNPDPKDRLNLRVKPDQKSTSLGKYYNGAPVRILENKGDWARVDILGVEGWMMTKYLAIGEAMKNVTPAHPQLQTLEGGSMLHAEPNEEAALGVETADYASMKIIGIVNEQWYHVWFYNDGTGGYFRADDLWPGNG